MRRSTDWMVIAAILAAAAGHIVWLAFVCDDSFIAFRYARNLATGHGLVFNPGERVEGFTSLLWTLVSASVFRLGGLPEKWAPRLSALAALASLAFLLFHQRRAGRDFLVLGVLVAGSAGWAAWATGGLETGLFTALVTVAFVTTRTFATGEGGRVTRWTAGAALGLACLTRPDGALIAALLTIHAARQARRGTISAGAVLSWAGLWILPLILLLLWRTAYYGHLVPNTFAVKARGVSMIPRGLEYLGYAFTRLHLYLIALPLLAGAARRARNAPSGAPGLALWVAGPYLAYVAWVGGDFMDLFRFVVPVLPILFLAAAEATAPFLSEARGRAAIAIWLAAWIGLNVSTSIDARHVHWRHDLDSIGALARYVDEWSAVGRFIGRVSAPTDTIAVTAAGCIPYHSGRYTVDQLGLVAPDLTVYKKRDSTRPGHMLQIGGEALLALHPQFLLGSAVVTPPDEVQRALYIEPGWESRFEQRYQTASVLLPEVGGRLTFAVRKDVAGRARGTGNGTSNGP